MNIVRIGRSLAILGMLGASGHVYATSLPVGGTVTPGTTTAPGGGPITTDPTTDSVGSLTEGFHWTSLNGKTTAKGVYVSDVYQGTGGYLDFYFQVQNTTTGADGKTAAATSTNTLVPSFAITNFAGFGTAQVFQLTKTGASTANFFGTSTGQFKDTGTGTPDTITSLSYSASGTFTVDLKSGLAPGQNSAVLLVEVKASDFDDAGSSTFNWKATPPPGTGNAESNPFFDDNLEAVFTPEPGFYGVLALGVSGLFFVLRRRSIKATPAV